MRKSVIILLLLASILFVSCSNSSLITKDVEFTGKVLGDLCNDTGKCIPHLEIFPQGFSFDYSDWAKVTPYYNKNVKVKGDLISNIEVYSCEDDYNDGLQHPINEKCETPGVKYYKANTYLKINSIEIVE